MLTRGWHGRSRCREGPCRAWSCRVAVVPEGVAFFFGIGQQEGPEIVRLIIKIDESPYKRGIHIYGVVTLTLFLIVV